MDLGPLVPIVAIVSGLGWGWLGYKKRELQVRADAARRDATEQRSEKQVLEQRVATLERIITDGGLQTAAQIEALRDEQPRRSRLPAGEDQA
jgi:hypothetical protein